MESLFNFATKELSQDAFLRWLFENYQCENENVRAVAYKLLNEFNGLSMKIGDIKKDSLKTFGQYKKIDIVVRFVYAGKVYFTVIEDKTYSSQHDNQLIRYYETMQKKGTIEYFTSKIPDSVSYDKEAPQINKVFYKTSVKNDSDLEACKDEKAGGWKPYFIVEIAQLLSEFSDTGSDILDSYLTHIDNLKNLSTEIPALPMEEWESISFEVFYKKLLSEIDEKIRGNIYFTGYYHYVSFVLDYYFPNTPYRIYLEVLNARKQDEKKKFHLLVRAEKTTEEKVLDKELKKQIREQFLALAKDYFQKAPDQKYAVANGKNEKKTLKYGDTPAEIEAIADYIKQVLTVFFSACQQIRFDN